MKGFLLWLFRRQLRVLIFMKSGNVVELRNVKEIEVEAEHGKVLTFRWEFGFSPRRQQILTIDPEQIEAIITD